MLLMNLTSRGPRPSCRRACNPVHVGVVVAQHACTTVQQGSVCDAVHESASVMLTEVFTGDGRNWQRLRVLFIGQALVRKSGSMGIRDRKQMSR